MNAGPDRPEPREPDQPGDLEALSDRLRDARGAARPDEDGPRRRSRAEGVAWRLAVEMVSAFAVCGFIGWWLDKWFGTLPWAMLTGLLLGGVAGLTNAFRVARAIQKDAEAADRS